MASRLPPNGYILGLDVGEKRIGTALASSIARLPQPGLVLDATNNPAEAIAALIQSEDVRLVVVGVPRNLEGKETAQSARIREFGDAIAQQIKVPLIYVDESLSSVRADDIGRNNNFQNVSRDSLAACFILEEFFETNTIEG